MDLGGCSVSGSAARCDLAVLSTPLSTVYAAATLLNVSSLTLDGVELDSDLSWPRFLPPLPGLPTTQRPPTLILGAGSRLSCRCEHAWLLPTPALDSDARIWVLDWSAHHHLRRLPSAHNEPWLRPRLVLGLPSPLDPAEMAAALPPGCSLKGCLGPPENRIQPLVSDGELRCSVEPQLCLRGHFASFDDHNTNLGGGSCAGSVTLNLHQNLTAGWLLCRAEGVPSQLPDILLIRVLPSHKYKLSGPTFVQKGSMMIFKFRVSGADVFERPLGGTLRWWFLDVERDDQLMWHIRPGTNFDVTEIRHLDFEPRVLRFRRGWSLRFFYARFMGTDQNCNFGKFLLEGCGAGRGNCHGLLFQVPSSFPHPCASRNATFDVVEQRRMPGWLINATLGDELPYGPAPTQMAPVLEPPSQHKQLMLVVLLIASVVLLVSVIGASVCLASFLRRKVRRLHRRHLAARYGDEGEAELLRSPNHDGGYNNWLSAIRRKSGLRTLPVSSVDVVRELGQGNFGKVFLVHLAEEQNPELTKGQEGSESLLPFEMAMKQLKFIDAQKLEDLEREASCLASLNHPNIVRFLGLTFRANPEGIRKTSFNNLGLGLLFEFMRNGDLVNYLRDHDPNDGARSEPLLDTSELLHMALNVAAGLEYLASQHLVHRDLAARNCLVGANLTVKLSDFGMSRDIYVTDYYKMGKNTLVPLRWLPPESLLFRKFTLESDVWSFGVLLWELFSYGQIPWCGLSNMEVMDVVKEGRELGAPDRCPAAVYERVLRPCWVRTPEERVTAAEARAVLEEIIDSSSLYCRLISDSAHDAVTTATAAGGCRKSQASLRKMSLPVSKMGGDLRLNTACALIGLVEGVATAPINLDAPRFK